ncbi:MAG: YraN family protein [Brevundimonas sp.]|jgi:putative endonuclease|uniref:YraN family protein n=1 Tax=Brevundimonas sp. TaxID=1871086 RepID=UPI00391AC1DD
MSGRAGASRGHRAEWWAAAWLVLKGYQILGFRLRPRARGTWGEIDILARRGGVLAIVEVKQRRTLDEALASLGPAQRQRLMSAAAALVRNRPALARLNLRLDMIVMAPGKLPRHLRNLIADEGLAI